MPKEHPNPSGKRVEASLILKDKNGKLLAMPMCMDWGATEALYDVLPNGPDAEENPIRKTAALCWALTATYREENYPTMTLAEFKKLLPRTGAETLSMTAAIAAAIDMNTSGLDSGNVTGPDVEPATIMVD